MDMMGHMQVESLGGKRFVFVRMDDFSMYTLIHFIKENYDTCDVVKMVEHCVQQLRSGVGMCFVGSLTYFLGLQVKQLSDIFSKALEDVSFEKLRGVIGIFMCEIL